jgi:hypothetical protein
MCPLKVATAMTDNERMSDQADQFMTPTLSVEQVADRMVQILESDRGQMVHLPAAANAIALLSVRHRPPHPCCDPADATSSSLRCPTGCAAQSSKRWVRSAPSLPLRRTTGAWSPIRELRAASQHTLCSLSRLSLDGSTGPHAMRYRASIIGGMIDSICDGRRGAPQRWQGRTAGAAHAAGCAAFSSGVSSDARRP